MDNFHHTLNFPVSLFYLEIYNYLMCNFADGSAFFISLSTGFAENLVILLDEMECLV